MGPATGLSCPHSLVADGPLEADALLALEEALRVDLGLDRLELREAVRAPDVLLHRDALLLALGVRKAVGDARRPPPWLARGSATAASVAPQSATMILRALRFLGAFWSSDSVSIVQTLKLDLGYPS